MSFNEDEKYWVNIAQEQSRGGRDTCHPVFYKRAIQNLAESDKEGRPIFKEVDYVRIIIPGDSKNEFDGKVTEEHKKRWPKHWEYFLNNHDNKAEGTPIEQWPQLSVSEVAELKAIRIFTVEQLASLDDAALSRIGRGARDMKSKAELYLHRASKQAMVNHSVKLNKENEELKKRISELEHSLSELHTKIVDSTPIKKRKNI